MIRPFDAWQYDTGAAGANWEALCCPPYDVVSEDGRRELERRSPYNCIRLELPSGDRPYERAAGLLGEWKRAGVLKRAGAEAYFVYETSFRSGGKDRVLRGFTGRCALTPFSEGRVMPHEETHSRAKADRMELMLAAKCNFSQLYMLYSDPGGVIPEIMSRAALNEPGAVFTLDGVTHRVWRVDDAETVGMITAGMSDKRVYIADGHHRYETALAYRDRIGVPAGDPLHPANYVMATFFDLENPGLTVLPTHRVIHGCDPEAAPKLLNGHDFTAEPCDKGLIDQALESRRGAVAMYLNGAAWLLSPRDGGMMRRLLPGACDAYLRLDVAFLHSAILEPRFAIGARELAEQKHITYTRDTQEALRMVDAGHGQCAFLLPPTRVSQIRDVSLAGGKMPQKSTYFYPKLITGLYFNGLDVPARERLEVT